jgi:hypothetical protein
MINSRLSLCFLVTLLLGHLGVAGQLELQSAKQAWDSGDYLDAVSSLKAYLQSIGDDERNFAADYMMATSLARLPDYHELGCRYFMSMSRLYGQSYSEQFDGGTIALQAAWNAECPPPPVQPGVHVAPVILPPKRGQVIGEIQLPQKKKQPKKGSKAPKGNAEFNGAYQLFYLGLKGELDLKQGSGIVVDESKHIYKLVVRIDSDHIVFYAVGLNGENVDATGGQKFDGYLMPLTRDAIAGLTWAKGRPSGFYAIRRSPKP